MKKYISLPGLLLFAIYSFSQTPGQLKITIESFKCINKSWDGLVEFDGHGNEVSVAYSYRIYSPSNINAARKGADGTVIYGSNVNGMTRGGTQTPDLGGITNGDVVPVYKPMLDEHINADEYIVIAPTVWEWDGPEKNTINKFNAQLETDLNWVMTQPYPFTNSPLTYSDPFNGRVFKIYDKYSYGQALKYHSIFKPIFCPLNTQGNKVIGINAGTFNNECLVVYPPTLLVLDTKLLYGLYINNHNAGNTGTSHAAKEAATDNINGVTINFKENTYAIETSNGSYSVTLGITFTPDQQPATNSAAPKLTKQPFQNSIATQSAITKNLAPAAYSMNTDFLNGVWKGVLTSNADTKNPPFLFKINNNAFWLLNANGASLASGGYKIENNNFSATYFYPNGENYSVHTVNYNPATKELSGTWTGNGANAAKKGNWTAIKQSN